MLFPVSHLDYSVKNMLRYCLANAQIGKVEFTQKPDVRFPDAGSKIVRVGDRDHAVMAD
jgi:hypothetical protein